MRTGYPNLNAAAQIPSSSHHRPPLALILSDNEPANLGKLTLQRSKAALPFAGEYRLIDFALSNCIHSGIDTVGIVTQYQPRSLHTHLAYGRPWGLDKRQGGLTLLHPYQGQTGMQWYGGTADAIYYNQDFIRRHRPDHVLIMAGDEIYKLDLSALVAQHCKNNADLTIAAVSVSSQDAKRHDTLLVDQNGWVQGLHPPGSPEPGSWAVMGVMLFSIDALSWQLSQDQSDPNSAHSLTRDVIPRMIQARDRVLAYQYTDYWSPILSTQDYWRAGMDLLGESSPLNLQDSGWPILTQIENRPPTRIESGARVSHSLLCSGCIIEGTVEYAILSPGVYVGPGAIVRSAIVMHNTTIEECARVENAILDIDVTIGQQAQVGMARRHAPTINTPVSPPITVVEKGAHVNTQAVITPAETQDEIMVHTPQEINADKP